MIISNKIKKNCFTPNSKMFVLPNQTVTTNIISEENKINAGNKSKMR